MPNELKHILYVEDDPYIAEVAIMTLEDLGGYSVQHCDSGAKALAVLATSKPDLILLDVMMPEMDGVETFSEIRGLSNSQDVPIVFMTAKAQEQDQAEYLKLGAAGVVAKPFDAKTLCSQIEALWAASQGS